VIVVVGRPGLSTAGRLGMPAARVALAAAETGARVELVGSVGDDADGERVALELGRHRIGHAALLRDPAATTPHEQPDAEDEETGAASGALPHLDAADVALGLSYLADCQVLVVAEPLSPAALAAASEAAAYHGAALIVVGADDAAGAGLPEDATVLGVPEGDAAAFSRLVGLYAAQLEAGRQPADAWHEALATSGWEPAAE
jgi:sugar/nucleoside kinase (ribokinase family)